MYLLIFSLILKKDFTAHLGCGESNYSSCTYYFLLKLLTVSPLLQSVLLKMQICSKVIAYQGTFDHNTNFTFIMCSFIYEKYQINAENCTQLDRAIQEYMHTPQTSTNYLGLPCLMSCTHAYLVLQKALFLPLHSNSQAVTFRHTLPKASFRSF